MTDSESIVYVIDDDAEVRKSLALLFSSVNLNTRTFSGAVEFIDTIAELPLDHCCLITDVRMAGMTGIELMSVLQRKQIAVPIIFISGHGDIAMAVKALKDGAEDFLTKPFDEDVLLDTVNIALRRQNEQSSRNQAVSEYADRYATLTRREKEIMQRVVNGTANKVIALDLNVTQRTVELHRANAMKKMQAKTFSDLVRMSIALDTNERPDE